MTILEVLQSYLMQHKALFSSISRVDPVVADNVQWYQYPIMIHDVLSKRSLVNISKNTPIEISQKLGVLEHILIGVHYSPQEIETYTILFKEFHNSLSWSYKEVLDIDPKLSNMR
jgi:hypothetical protein